jgi:uncharacterized protein (TIGR03083 family)
MAGRSTFGQRIDVRDEFTQSRARLLELLDDLAPDEWDRPTAAAPWTVRDVAAHLLGDDLNRLSRGRDGHSGAGPEPGESLPDFIHRINDQWVQASGRVSSAVLVALLATTTPQIQDFWRRADLDAYGEPVTWASPEPAPVWLDCARDFTEYWVHQEQIRDATGRPRPDVPDEVRAVLDTFLRAVPHTLGNRHEDTGAGLVVQVDGPERAENGAGATTATPGSRHQTNRAGRRSYGSITPRICGGSAPG